MEKVFWKKLISTTLCACLVWTSGDLAEAVLGAPQLRARPALPIPLELAPPPSLGWVVDAFASEGAREQGSKGEGPIRKPLVILIQDLHAHYGDQKNIAGLLEFLTKKLRSRLQAPGNTDTSAMLQATSLPAAKSLEPRAPALPFVLAVEGAQGPIDSSVMALFPDPKVKQEACDYLMREGELTGSE